MTNPTGRLAGKVIIITGASTGTGPVMGKRFAEEGAKVVLSARREELVKEVAAAAGPNVIGVRCDVTNEADVAAMVKRTMDEFGQIDALLNNAAAPGQDKWVWEQTLENWNATIAIDLTAAKLCTREVLNASMLERKRGSIINFSSAAGWRGDARKTHYVSAKSALRGFTKSVANDVGPYGIRCNCLVPGSIDTELWQNYARRRAGEEGVAVEDWRAATFASLPLRTISKPNDIANLALFLASDESRTITGQSINCDAGGYMNG